MLVSGMPTSEDAARDFFNDGPPNAPLENVFCLAVRHSGELVGAMHLAKDEPHAGSWYIGVLMIHPDKRGCGLGGAVVQKLKEALRAHGATEIRCSVVEENARASAFWQRNGFNIIDTLPAATFGIKSHVR